MKIFYNLKTTLILLSALLFLGISNIVNAGHYNFPDAWGNQGLTVKSVSNNKVSFNVSVANFSLTDINVNGETMQELSYFGIPLPNEAGAPNLPALSKFVAVPQGATATIEITNYRIEKIQNVNISPSPIIPKENEDGLVLEKNINIYSKNAFYPESPTAISEVFKMRGVDVVSFNISPFAYNPVTKELLVYRDIEATITFNGGNGQFGDTRLRSRFFDPILYDNIVNSEVLPVINYDERNSNILRAPSATGCEYLIITANDPSYKKWADSLRVFRTEQGISTKVVTLQEVGGNTISAIETYVDNAYNTWDIPPVAVLLIGDYGTNDQINITSPIHNNYCVSDNMFADVDNNNLPEMAFARMTANNEAQLKVMVTKVLEYERTPPTSPDFYNHPITALGWQTERWFQICSEVVGGYFKNTHGKDPVRINAIYQGTPGSVWSTATNTNTVVNYFGPNGLNYIPATPSELGGWSGGNAQKITNALNAGSFLLQHRDHGLETGWGEPDYRNNNINDLTNVGKMSFIFSLNCLTGKYNYSSECFAEKFHRHTYNNQNAGCVGIIAASETSYSFVNDTYTWGMLDMMWPDFMPDYGQQGPIAPRGLLPALGNVAGKYFLQQSSWPYNTNNKIVTYHLFHHHGDAFLELFSEVPQNLTVVHPQVMINSTNSFTITADQGATIAFTHNGQILATATGTGQPMTVNFNPPLIGQTVKVVATKTNHYRHKSSFIIISDDNPYVITEDYTINDALGNNNQKIDYDETVLLSLIQRNLGNTDAQNVTVSVTDNDPYITFIDNSELYPLIVAKQTATIADGFKIKVADGVPDQYNKVFKAKAVSGQTTWESYFSLTCNAPVLNHDDLIIDDSQSGNGNNRLDPGETAIVKIAIKNNGHSSAINTNVNISLATGLIELQNNNFVIDNILPSQKQYAEFTVNVSPDAPEGLKTELFMTAVAGEYSTQFTYSVAIGLLVEDWETGDFTKFEWQNGGNLPWTIETSNVYEGTYSAKSGDINNYQTSQLVLTYDIPQNDTISFMYKTSCEVGGDGLKFYIDNVLQETFDGEKDWTRAAIAVNGGTRLFKWIYYKNGSGEAGQDCAWLDFIVFPLEPKTTAYAGFDGFVCENDTYTCHGRASNFSTVAWTTSGTGTFSNSTILRAVYTPSAQDIANGEVTLTLTVNGVSGTVSDDVLITFQQPATANAGTNGTVCSNTPYSLSDATAANYTTVLWETSGTGVFENKFELNTSYTPSIEDAASGSVVLTLNASNESCSPTSSTKTLQVSAGPNPAINGELTACSNNEYTYQTNSVAGNEYIWTVENGEIISGQGTNSIVVKWNNTSGNNASIEITEKNANNCETTVSKNITLLSSPSPVLTGNLSTCLNTTETYSTPLVSGNTYSWNVTGGTIISGEGTNEITVNWNALGTANLTLIESNSNCEVELVNDIFVKSIITTNPTTPTGAENVDLYFGLTSEVSVAEVAEASEYQWEINPSTAGTITSTNFEATINWNSNFKGDAKIKVKAINSCSNSEWSDELTIKVINTYSTDITSSDFGVKISPNPNNGNFKIQVNTPEKTVLNIKIVSLTGSIVYQEKEIQSNGRFVKNLNINLPSGVYTVVVSDNKSIVAKKLIIK